jgi:hypothetical protein
MGNILSWKTVDAKVKSYIDHDLGIDKSSHAFSILMVANLMGISDEEAADAITDGPDDCGIDAVYIDVDNQIHLFQFKYATTFENSKKNFPSNEIDKVHSYLTNLLDTNVEMQSTCNLLLWNKTQEIWVALDRPAPKFHVHFCGNLELMIEAQLKRANRTVKIDDNFEVHHYSLSDIARLFLNHSKPKIDRNITVVDRDYFDRTDGNIRGMICTVEASQIVDMVTDPNASDRVLGDIFDDNVRIYLSSANKINEKIIESALSQENYLFWYMNNGITMTCDSFSYVKSRAPTVELKNVQIVNGGQTTHALFEAAQKNREAIENVLVMARIIETKSREISVAIAESTNRQTPIKGRDLRANDDLQKRIELAFNELGYSYERKFKQWQNEDRQKRIDALEAGQARLAYALGYPETAKKERGRVFSDLYDTVYTEDLDVEELLSGYKLMLQIDKEKKAVQKLIRAGEDASAKMFLIDGAFHVLYATGLLAQKAEIDLSDFEKASKKISAAISLVKKVVDRVQRDSNTFSFNRFFKDSKTKELIRRAVVAKR